VQRRSLLSLAALLPIPFLIARFRPAVSAHARTSDLQQEAVELNSLASNIRSPQGARNFVDRTAQIFSDILPPEWTTRSLRIRIARAEFTAVTNRSNGTPEDRIADLWNQYIDALGGQEDLHITTAELHNLRDALFATFSTSWQRSYRNIWAIPGIYATNPDGTLASRCRILESLRLFYDLACIPGSLQNARDRNRQGILVSDLLRRVSQGPVRATSSVGHAFVTVGVGAANPVEAAARHFVQQHGVSAFTSVVGNTLDKLLS
jgi:hypothetical protein